MVTCRYWIKRGQWISCPEGCTSKTQLSGQFYAKHLSHSSSVSLGLNQSLNCEFLVLMKWNLLSGLWSRNHQHQSHILRTTTFFGNNSWTLGQEFKVLQWDFQKPLWKLCGPVQSSFVKPRVSSEPCCPPTCRCFLRLYWAFCLILHVCKHCKIRFSLIVPGMYFVKGRPRGERSGRNIDWERERKTGKKQRGGIYMEEQNKDREKLLINNIIYMKYKRIQPAPVIWDIPDLIQML